MDRIFGRRHDDEHRRRRLASELADAGLGEVDEAVLAEVVHALELQPHEGVLATYGAIVLSQGEIDLDGWGTRVDFDDLDRLRELADGATSFVVHSSDGWHLAVGDRPAGETDLVALCTQRNASIVRLLPEGRVQVLAGEYVFALERARWKRHPTSAAYVRRLLASSPRAQERPHVARGLLDLAVHILSPGRIGATLVWLPGDDRTGVGGLLGHGGTVPALPASKRTIHRAMANLLGQHDGATLLSPDGRLLCTGVELLGDPDSDVLRHRGMRHRSAARFSRLRPDAVVVVVSEDGPVSIYVDGVDITREAPDPSPQPAPDPSPQPAPGPSPELTTPGIGGTG